MLSESIYHEIHFLLYSILLGVIITFVYDNIRVFRRVIRHNTFVLSMEDLFFWVGVAISVFLLQHKENNGIFRWFSVLGAFLGMVVYRLTISHFYVKEMTYVFRKVLYLLYLFFSYLFSPIYFLEQKTANLAKKAGRGVKRGIGWQKRRLTSYGKMIKMTLCKRKKKTHSERRAHEQKNHNAKKEAERL